MSGAQEAGHATAPQGHSAAARDERTERRVAVAAMLHAHVTTREMAKRLNVGKGTIDRDIRVIRRYYRTLIVRDYDALVAEEVGKLEELERAFAPLARAGDTNAAAQLRWIMDHRARLLAMYAPLKSAATVTIEHTTPLDAEIERLLAVMHEPSSNGSG